MLKGIPKIISPSLLKILCEMGHGDEIVLADGNFPSENMGERVVRADGIGGEDMLRAVLALIPLDTYAEQNFILMQTVPGDEDRKSGTVIKISPIHAIKTSASEWRSVLLSMSVPKRHTRSLQPAKKRFTLILF